MFAQVQGYAEIVQVSATEIKVAYHLYNLAPGSQGWVHRGIFYRFTNTSISSID